MNIRVNSVCPGAIRTPLKMEAWGTPEAYRELMELIPYKRIGEPEDIGRSLVWLASDESDYIHGANIFVDGGMPLYPGFETGGYKIGSIPAMPRGTWLFTASRWRSWMWSSPNSNWSSSPVSGICNRTGSFPPTSGPSATSTHRFTLGPPGACFKSIANLFVRNETGQRPVLKYHPKLATDPHFRDYHYSDTSGQRAFRALPAWQRLPAAVSVRDPFLRKCRCSATCCFTNTSTATPGAALVRRIRPAGRGSWRNCFSRVTELPPMRDATQPPWGDVEMEGIAGPVRLASHRRPTFV